MTFRKHQEASCCLFRICHPEITPYRFAFKFPILADKFPVPQKYFPVLLSREFRYKPLNLLACQPSGRGRAPLASTVSAWCQLQRSPSSSASLGPYSNLLLFSSLARCLFSFGLWCRAFLGKLPFYDLFVRAGTGPLWFFRRRNVIYDRAGRSHSGAFVGKLFGSYSGPCLYRRRNLIQDHPTCSRGRSGGRCRSIGNLSSKCFRFFGGGFPCG